MYIFSWVIKLVLFYLLPKSSLKTKETEIKLKLHYEQEIYLFILQKNQ